jgi:hypothetical protein
LALEEAIGGEACDPGYGASKLVSERTNDRDMGRFGADEFARHGEDQAGLNVQNYRNGPTRPKRLGTLRMFEAPKPKATTKVYTRTAASAS